MPSDTLPEASDASLAPAGLGLAQPATAPAPVATLPDPGVPVSVPEPAPAPVPVSTPPADVQPPAPILTPPPILTPATVTPLPAPIQASTKPEAEDVFAEMERGFFHVLHHIAVLDGEMAYDALRMARERLADARKFIVAHLGLPF